MGIHSIPLKISMRYCSNCGTTVELKIPEGDNLPRYVCCACGIIHYQNPKIVVGCIPEWDSKILLCRRAIEPRKGLWTVPGGFMENSETLAQGAARETLEEANARVQITNLFAIYNLPHINQVHIFFRAQLLDMDFQPGAESLDVRLFEEEEMPWDKLAFRVVGEPLRRYFQERRQGNIGFHMGTIQEIGK
jgi:ADP-ribose pyrophosphatase YjhB (NUDIX family)